MTEERDKNLITSELEEDDFRTDGDPCSIIVFGGEGLKKLSHRKL